jgi:hypothetical protein
MTEFPREFFLVDPYLQALYNVIISMHVTEEPTRLELIKNKDVKGFHVKTRYFVELPKKDQPSLFIHYDTETWLVEDRGKVKITSIGVYQDSSEYMKARLKQIHNPGNTSIPNIN